ncbi:ABC transporter related [Gluconacetobacter diazotrophicus PA1 5]|uniref:ATP-binding cassette domain-containing protein n=1 Tax=Gluconacetobacter diazotrophicus TaxID=33996 RepID=A0A7W4I7J9_GLUDI|nr:ATP-binding cassette domain-containing protein [Gluconacetobacter diazotrophicus]ACI52950.1 ABC transporter related [Gluconacetobacter diazotrophicus PA1 5]MBB2157727.1 ATP-binding cassette domain-containing protein [Gluconacetobacter diazotrophicus]TWB08905.1 putative ABC transport system ATP-binding protein [Gluconacetobacter diazotrophicus]
MPEFILRAGDRVAIVGPSGCGKSTLLGLLSLALRPRAVGRLEIGGQDVSPCWNGQHGAAALGRIRAAGMGFVPQMSALLPFLSVRANIALPLDVLGRTDRARVQDLAARLDILGQLDRMPVTLSVGQRQRAAIARAVVHRPRLVLADEPTAALHPDQAAGAMRLLFDQGGADSAVVMVTHDGARAAETGFSIVSAVPHVGGARIATAGAGQAA